MALHTKFFSAPSSLFILLCSGPSRKSCVRSVSSSIAVSRTTASPLAIRCNNWWMSRVVKMSPQKSWAMEGRDQFFVWIKRRYKNKSRWGKPSWFPATMKILTLDIYIMSEEFLSPWFHEYGSDHIQGVRVKMSTVIWMELTEAGCLTSSPVCWWSTFSVFHSLTFFYLSYNSEVVSGVQSWWIQWGLILEKWKSFINNIDVHISQIKVHIETMSWCIHNLIETLGIFPFVQECLLGGLGKEHSGKVPG